MLFRSDRLYSERADSPRRRSAQTALWRIASGLARMLSPILAFTSDEAWEHLPGREHESVHLATWNPSADAMGEEERATWKALLATRAQALPELEKARQAKIIGKALEATLSLVLEPAAHGILSRRQGELMELLSVSGIHVAEGERFGVVVEPASGAKCERCWRRDAEVGRSPQHPGLCPRCVVAVA